MSKFKVCITGMWTQKLVVLVLVGWEQPGRSGDQTRQTRGTLYTLHHTTRNTEHYTQHITLNITHNTLHITLDTKLNTAQNFRQHYTHYYTYWVSQKKWYFVEKRP